MEKYTGREIAIFTDVHGLLEPLVAILDDIKKRGIKEIYSLGDNIGLGPNPSQVLDLLGENRVKIVNGNGEEYIVIGIDPFRSYFGPRRIASQEWVKSQLTSEQIRQLRENKHSYDLVVGGMKIGLCHFGNDVRIDFGHNTWSYQKSINCGYPDPQKQFYYTNSDLQKMKIEERSKQGTSWDAGYVSAKNDPIFGGKQIDYYDEIIQGHVHFKFLTEDEKVRIRTIRAAGMAYGKNESIDHAYYIIIREKEIGYDVEEVFVPYKRDKMIQSINDSDMPDKWTITRFTSKR